ncbi:MAG: thiamine phosphate synthase [Zymomonas mobilis subsp. pomaceae]|nr:thiamine phosphate synthase [Zymomonas mobilis]MDX5948219.1 thiamine phosphate synthase [Zymomonas mobilis subsp. pomaceae]
MTDERLGESLIPAIKRLPRHSGIIFRHYYLPLKDRKKLFFKIKKIAKKRNIILFLADSPQRAAAWRADGVHGSNSLKRTARPLLRSKAIHNQYDIATAQKCDLVLLSPIFATRSHPGKAPLGRVKFLQLSRFIKPAIIALGGIKAKTLRALPAVSGFAGIDIWQNNELQSCVIGRRWLYKNNRINRRF